MYLNGIVHCCKQYIKLNFIQGELDNWHSSLLNQKHMFKAISFLHRLHKVIKELLVCHVFGLEDTDGIDICIWEMDAK